VKGHCAPTLSIRNHRFASRRLPQVAARFLLALLGSLCVLAILPGCTAGRHAANGSAPAGGKSFRYPLFSEATTLDPALVEDGMTIDLLQNIYEGLVKWDEKNQIVPNLAEKWDVSPDGKTYTFHIRHGVKFHNGRELTAQDFKYSMERCCDPKTQSPTAPTYLKDIVGAMDRINGKASEVSGIKVLDPYTLQITIDAFKPYWLGNMTYPTGYAVCREAIEETGGKVDEHSAIGTGPFKLASFQRDYQVTLEADPDYHEGRPKLDNIVRPVLQDGNTRLNKYAANELDDLIISPQDLDRVNADANLKPDLHTFPRAEIWYLALNQAAAGSPFGNRDVRRAFAMAVDKNEVIRVALKNTADLANGIVPPEMPDYHSEVRPVPFDPAQARQLLAKAGYPGGKGFPLLNIAFRQDQPEVGKAAEIMAEQLKTNLGINLQLRPTEWSELLTERMNKSLPIIFLRWAADYLDPQDFLSVMLHTSHRVNGQEDHPENGVGYSNPQFDALCDEADVEHDPQKRMALYRQAEQIAVDDAPWVPIYFKKDVELIKPWVGGIRDSMFGHLPHVTTIVSR